MTYFPGTTGNDSFSGDNTSDEAYGLEGNDTLNAGSDVVWPVEGTDNDLLSGGDGNDVLLKLTAGDVADGGDGTDSAEVWLTVTYEPWIADTVIAVTNATSLNVHLTDAAGSGSLSLTIGGGTYENHVVLTSIETYNITFGSGNDTVWGGDNDDRLIGEMYSFVAQDTLGFDELHGEAGDDYLDGMINADTLYGGAGNDTIDGGTLASTGGFDDLSADSLYGDEGDDRFIYRTLDYVDGGDGTDTLEVVFHTAMMIDLAITGPQNTGAGMGTIINIENIVGSSLGDILSGDGGNNVISGATGADTISGRDGDDVLSGGAFDGSSLDGGVGNDTLNGGFGNDTLNGGSGIDSMVGSLGNDVFVTDGNDILIENFNQGTDTIQTDLTWTLTDNFENLTLTGTAAINGTGHAGHNVLTGNDGNNVLTGGLGDDTYYIQNTGDNVVEANGEGTDTLFSSVTYSLSGRYIESFLLTGTGAINATGNSLNNTITGNSGANTISALGGHDVLDGGAGNDTLVGSTGNDTYYVDATGDSITELAGEGTDYVFSAATFTLAAEVEHLTLTGSAAVNATGNTLSNILTGNDGNNILTGLNGNDTYYVQNTGDNVVENSTGGTDTVFSTVTYNLNGRYIETLTLTGTANINATGNSLTQTLTGNDGNNTLNGKGGSDILTGGLGADIFLFEAASGTDTITDFNAAQNDSINVNAYTAGVANPGMVVQAGANVTITLSAGNVITVNNATQADVLAHMVW